MGCAGLHNKKFEGVLHHSVYTAYIKMIVISTEVAAKFIYFRMTVRNKNHIHEEVGNM
jgi:hypothetical protein